MDGYERLKAIIIATIVRDIPKQFWIDLRAMARQAYADVYFQIRNDPNLNDEQRIDLLRQYRHYRMESLLCVLADRHGLVRSLTLLSENSQHYAYVVSNDVGMTQSYVPAIGELPKPARYWEQLAEANEVPRLDLGDEPPAILLGKSYYGLIAHNPVGKRFGEDEQKLGMIQFCVPTKDGRAWGLELALEELTAAYPDGKPTTTVERKPVWKDRSKEEKKRRDGEK